MDTIWTPGEYLATGKQLEKEMLTMGKGMLHQRVIHAFEDWCKANLPLTIAEMEGALVFSKAAHDAIERGENPFA